MFSLALPQAGIQKPIEISILSPSDTLEVTASTGIAPAAATSKVSAPGGKNTMPETKGAIKISPERLSEPPVQDSNLKITRKLELPDFFTDIEIEGPIGERTLVHRETLEYPDWMQKKGIGGDVTIKFWVDPSGKIAITNLITSSGSSELDMYAQQVFKKWLFEPAATDKQTWGIITFHF